MTDTVSHQQDQSSTIAPTTEELFSQKKKLEFLALNFDPADFPPSHPMIKDLMEEFHFVGDDPFIITNQILVRLDQTLEEISKIKPN